jgi:DNA polymerase V
MQAPSSLPINYAIFSPLASQPQPHAIPLISFRMPAGFPSQADGYIEDGLDLNEYLAPNGGACFMFTIDGDSLKNAGILHGDKVVVDRSKDVRNGCIVIAEIDYEYTAKFFFRRSNRIELHPANPAFQPIVIRMEQELRIWGVVVGALRRYV